MSFPPDGSAYHRKDKNIPVIKMRGTFPQQQDCKVIPQEFFDPLFPVHNLLFK